VIRLVSLLLTGTAAEKWLKDARCNAKSLFAQTAYGDTVEVCEGCLAIRPGSLLERVVSAVKPVVRAGKVRRTTKRRSKKAPTSAEKPKEEGEWIRAKQAALLAGLSYDEILRLIKSGEIKGIARGRGYKVEKSSLNSYLEKQAGKTASGALGADPPVPKTPDPGPGAPEGGEEIPQGSPGENPPEDGSNLGKDNPVPKEPDEQAGAALPDDPGSADPEPEPEDDHHGSASSDDAGGDGRSLPKIIELKVKNGHCAQDDLLNALSSAGLRNFHLGSVKAWLESGKIKAAIGFLDEHDRPCINAESVKEFLEKELGYVVNFVETKFSTKGGGGKKH
jgi:excisionase family DNA binding protein